MKLENTFQYIQDLVSPLYNAVGVQTIFTVFCTLIVMIIGKRIDTASNKNRQKKEQRKVRSLVFLNCEELSKELTKQANAFESIADVINVDTNEPIPMSAFCVKSHTLLGEIKYERVYEAFQQKLKDENKLERFNLLWSNISTINESISNQKNFALDFIESNNRYQTDFETTLSQIATIIGNISTVKHGTTVSQQEHEFFIKVDNVNASMQGGSNLPTKIKSHYIEPLLQLFNTPQFYPIHRNGELANLLRKAQIQFINLDNHNTMSKQNALTLKSICLSLSESFKDFATAFKPNKTTINHHFTKMISTIYPKWN